MAFVSPLSPRLGGDREADTQIRNQGNLIYLALITDRIPVIPKFTPLHVLADGQAEDLPFGDVFDVPRLASLIGSPVLEWRDVKVDEQPVVESVGCWAVWPEQQSEDSGARESWFPPRAGLGGFYLSAPPSIRCPFDSSHHVDVSYTKGPNWLKAQPGNVHDKTSRFWDLARLSFPDARREWLNSGQPLDQTPSPILKAIEDPDQQMLCMDYLFYVGAIRVRCCRQAQVILLTPVSYRRLNTTMTFLPRGDTLPPTCTGPSASRPSASCISGPPSDFSLVGRSRR